MHSWPTAPIGPKREESTGARRPRGRERLRLSPRREMLVHEDSTHSGACAVSTAVTGLGAPRRLHHCQRGDEQWSRAAGHGLVDNGATIQQPPHACLMAAFACDEQWRIVEVVDLVDTRSSSIEAHASWPSWHAMNSDEVLSFLVWSASAPRSRSSRAYAPPAHDQQRHFTVLVGLLGARAEIEQPFHVAHATVEGGGLQRRPGARLVFDPDI